MTKSTRDPAMVPVTFINRSEQLSELSDAVSRSLRTAVDTETHAGKVLDDGIWAALRVISVACHLPDDSYQAFVIDVRDIPVEALKKVMSLIKQADAWNANFDEQILDLHGCNVVSWKDAMFTDGLLSAGSTGFEFWHGLAFAASKYLDISISGKGTTQVSYDGESDLTAEQIAYPAHDAVVTLWVAMKLDELVESQGLTIPVALEQAARPFILKMMKHGIPFDSAGWESEVLSAHLKGKTESLAELARLTGGGDTTLFETTLAPSWNPDSDKPTREAFNTFAKDAVIDFKGSLLTASDKLDKTTLKQIKHPLAKALISYREHSKTLSTYGDNLNKFIADDGRIRSRYRQGGVVATGRLASERPNAQNFDPEMKRFIRPGFRTDSEGNKIPRAFVYADLSQAELRVLAQVSEEERMRELFRLGGDFHARTAADMFKVDMESLKENDQVSYSNNRKKAKGVNFGIPYGLGAAALATNLTTNSGLKTSTEEAQAMLKSYATAYPEVNQWLSIRDRYVKEIAATPGDIDWDKSFLLHELWVTADPVRKNLKRRLGRHATATEIADQAYPVSLLRAELSKNGSEPSEDELSQARNKKIAQVKWAFLFDAPVALRPDGTVWSFESRTLTGRRRLFTIPMDSTSSKGFKGKFEGVLTHAMLIICTSDNSTVAELRSEFASRHGLSLPIGTKRFNRGDRNAGWKARLDERNQCIKEFEGGNKSLKYELLKFYVERYGAKNVYDFLLPMAVKEQIRSLGNRYRNHPIQSLVADVGLQYYAELNKILDAYTETFPVQAVHDSIAIECDLANAVEICAKVKLSLESALASWCPDVPSKADADIRLSLDDNDVITSLEIEEVLKKPLITNKE